MKAPGAHTMKWTREAEAYLDRHLQSVRSANSNRVGGPEPAIQAERESVQAILADRWLDSVGLEDVQDAIEALHAPPSARISISPHFASKWIFLFVAGLLCLAATTFYVRGVLERLHSPSPSARCQQNLRQIGLALHWYAHAHVAGHFPPLSRQPGRFACDLEDIYPEYLSDPARLWCPGVSPERPVKELLKTPELLDAHYLYFGYVIRNMDDAVRFFEAYKQATNQDLDFEGPLSTPNGPEFERLHKDLRDAASIPALIERPLDQHRNNRINVLFADGHVESIKMGERFPALEEFFALVENEDQRQH